MKLRVALLWPLACSVPFAGAAAADEDDGVAEPVPVPVTAPAFGDLRTWYNGIETSRIPPELQPLREPGNRALTPPRADREPLQARVSGALEGDDNLLLSTDHRRKGTALVVSPGLNWIRERARYRIEVDGSLEFLHGVQGDYDASRLDASTLQANALLRSSETTTVDYAGTLLRSHDPAGNTPSAPVAGATVDQRYATSYQRHELGAGWRVTPRVDVAARWVGTWADSRSPDYVRTQANDLELGTHWQADPALRLGVALRERRADFAALGHARYGAAWLEAEHQWSPTLIGRAAVGAAQGSGPSIALWRTSMTQTFSYGQWDLAFERDVSVPAGLGRLYDLRDIRIGTAVRVGPHGRLEVSLLGSDYRPLDDAGGAGGVGAVRTLRPRIAYTLGLGPRTWLSLRYQRIDDRAVGTSVRREGDRLLVTLLETF